jgi:peptidoglycan-associated lipoprotein
MRARTLVPLALAILTFGMAGGCKKQVPPDGPLAPRDLAVDDAPPKEVPPPPPAPESLGRVRFALDSAVLDAEAKAVLQRNAHLLTAHPTVTIEVQGHCDERGTTEYNIALGERRARAIESFLLARGVAASRITLTSYGEERPATYGHDEGAWAANRRGEVRIVVAEGVALEGSVP